LLKANTVVLSLFGLVAALGARQAVQALEQLGVPSKLCHLLLLTLRQIQLVGDEYRRMRQAMRARAFVPRSDRHSWRVLGWSLGMLLVHSLARAERVAQAMRCRGFDGRLHVLGGREWQRPDTWLMLTLAPLCLVALAVDRLICCAGGLGGSLSG
jgi:cobalt/nickel transport system permease protein